MISRAKYAASKLTMNYYTSAARVGRTASAARRPHGGRIAAADSVPTLYS